MKEYLDKSGLTYYSTKLYNNIKSKFTNLNTKISDLETKVDSDNEELNAKMENNNKILTQNTADIQTANNNINNLSTKVDSNYDELKTDFDSADMRPTGDSIYINNVEQFVFKDISAGETVTVPNSGDGSDFLIECFVKTETGTPLVHKSLTINTSTKDLLEYDDRYVEITDDGARPRNNVTLDLTLQGTIDEYNIYTTDLLPVELVDSINNLTDYTLTLDESGD